MIRLHVPKPLPGLPVTHWFAPLPENMTYKKDLPPNFFESDVERVEDASTAAAIVLPNNFKTVLTREEVDYIKKYADLGQRRGKPVVAFSLGDFTDKVVFDERVYALRYSLYKHRAGPRDISMPNQTEDSAKDGIALRSKNVRPLVSFCGMGDLPTVRSRLAYTAKNFYFEMRALFSEQWRAKKLGVYWRRASMQACSRSALVDTHFIVRKTFSGNTKTIELDPAQARKEYLESILNADFVLAPKGDGNYSNRFLKTLCMGRIPVVVDTDIVLPLEAVIDYSPIMVRVPMSRVHETPIYIREFYDSLSDEQWRARQQLARATFEKYLRQDAYLKYFFTKVLPTLS